MIGLFGRGICRFGWWRVVGLVWMLDWKAFLYI